MRTTKKVTRPAREDTVIDKLTCDLCGREAPDPDGYHPWATDYYDAVESDVKLKRPLDPKVKLKTGQSYPEGGDGEEIEFDICPECFTGKLIPWLESQGAKAVKRDWEW
jgi:hypothetical protein